MVLSLELEKIQRQSESYRLTHNTKYTQAYHEGQTGFKSLRTISPTLKKRSKTDYCHLKTSKRLRLWCSIMTTKKHNKTKDRCLNKNRADKWGEKRNGRKSPDENWQ